MMKTNKTINFFVKLLATGFFLGYIPWASGTFSSILGVIIWIFFSRSFFYYIILFIFLVSGIFLSDYAEKMIFYEKDSSRIVIDEIAGMLVTFTTFEFTFTAQGILYLIIGFILFRFFDIVKPFRIKDLQTLEGGVGIMIDDLVSGVLANLILQIIRLMFW